MLDPLTALSVASSLVQFVDFGVKLVSNGVELYEKGRLGKNDELELITKDLTRLTEDIATSTQPGQTDNGKPPSKDEYALQELAASCKEIGEQLLDLLESLKIQKSGKKLEDGVASFRKALRSASKKGQVQNVKKRLKKMQDQLNTNILALLSNKQSRVLSQLNELLAENRRSETNTQNKIDELRADILLAVEQAKEQAKWKGVTQRANTFSKIGTKCLDLAEEGERVATIQQILRSLNFKYIKARQSAIKEAHKKTFDWIFEEVGNDPTPRPRFLSWLREGNGIYWVSGKAGSGKSTLLKLLCDHESTKAVLQAWAGREKLVTACYFFWSAGNDLQKSQQGLLQSFLFQILSQCPDLIHIVCPSRCSVENLAGTADVWTLQELIGCFEILSKQDLLSAKFCFFVDGLDEYNGEDTDVIKTLQDLIRSSKVKICASSRPWNAFEKAFGNNHSQKLLLQDYTKEDIRLYVTETLEKNESFVTLSRRDPQYKQLIDDIVERARGVFLWVYLVVRSLLRGLTDDNDIIFMHKRLDSLPVDLEDYFKQMMNTIEEIYQEQTARIFQLVVQTKSPLSAIAFWFFAKEKDNPNYAMEAKIKSLDDAEVGLISERMRTYLNACCKDLLEVNVDQSAGLKFLSYQVDFLHRTVRDFLMTKDMHTLLQNRTSADFDARVSLCKLSLAQVKALPNLPQSQGLAAQVRTQAQHLMCEVIIYAYEVEIYNGVAEYALLNELDRSLTVYLNLQKVSKLKDGSKRVADLGVFRHYDTNEFISFATAAGLSLYVGQRLDSHPTLLQEASKKRSLLDFTFQPKASNTGLIGTLQRGKSGFDIEMARVLFARGADPNSHRAKSIDKHTVWDGFLSICSKDARSAPTKDLFQMAELFIGHGADLDIKVRTGSTQRTVTKETTPLVRTKNTRTSKYAVTVQEEVFSSPLEILQGALLQSQYEHIEALIAERRPAKSSPGLWSWLGWK